MLIQNATSAAPMPTSPASSGGAPVVSAPPPRIEVKQAADVKQQASSPLPNAEQVKRDIERINAALQRANKNVELSFTQDAATKMEVVKVTDKDTGETLVQYPSNAVLGIAQSIEEFQQGMLLKREA